MTRSISIKTFLVRLSAAFIAVIFMAAPGLTQDTDHRGVAGPIELDGKSYELAWSGKPAGNYIKPECVPGPEGRNLRRLILRVAPGADIVEATLSRLQLTRAMVQEGATLRAPWPQRVTIIFSGR